MNDNQFDDFVNDRLKEYAAPVPAGLWEKVAEGQFDQYIGSKLREHTAPVPEGLWEKIADHNFDNFIAGRVDGTEAPVPAGLWEKIADGQFDSFVSGKVSDYEAPVPAGLWEKIKPEEEDDDRVAFWWFRYPVAAALLLALLTAGIWAGYRYFSKEKTIEVAQAPSTMGRAPANSSTANHADGNLLPAQATPPVEKIDNNSIANAKDDAANTRNLPGKTDAHVNLNSQTPEANPSDKNNSNTGRSGLSFTAKAPGNPGTNVSSQHVNRGNTANDQRFAPGSKNNEIVNNKYNIFTDPNNTLAAGINNGDNAPYLLNVNIPPYEPGFTEQSTIPQVKYSLKDLSDKQFTGANRKYKSVIICPSDKDRTGWYLEPYVSADLSFKSVSNISASPLYMLKKDSAERSRIGYSAGIRLVKPITENFLVKAGVQFTQANEKYVYRTENEVKTTTVVTVRTIIRAPGDTVIVNDTSVLQTAGFKTNSVTNRIRSVDVPVTMGYQWGDDDLKFGINAGVVFNLTTWYHGTTLDTSLANVPLMNSGNGIYKTNLGLGLTGSISIVKKLSEGLHVFAEPYFRYNLSDMSTTQSGFRQRLSLGGLAVGLRLNLNRY